MNIQRTPKNSSQESKPTLFRLGSRSDGNPVLPRRLIRPTNTNEEIKETSEQVKWLFDASFSSM